MTSRRVERVASVIRRVLAEAIQARLHDPRIPTITSITRVEVSADFSVARVYVSVLDTPARQKLCVQALQSSAGFLRRLLGREVRLRTLPVLDFRLDDSLKRGFETCQILDRLAAARGPSGDAGDGTEADRDPTSGDQAGAVGPPDEAVADERRQEDA
jgi:ribosome-binding factor A